MLGAGQGLQNYATGALTMSASQSAWKTTHVCVHGKLTSNVMMMVMAMVMVLEIMGRMKMDSTDCF